MISIGIGFTTDSLILTFYLEGHWALLLCLIIVDRFCFLSHINLAETTNYSQALFSFWVRAHSSTLAILYRASCFNWAHRHQLEVAQPMSPVIMWSSLGKFVFCFGGLLFIYLLILFWETNSGPLICKSCALPLRYSPRYCFQVAKAKLSSEVGMVTVRVGGLMGVYLNFHQNTFCHNFWIDLFDCVK